MSIGKIWPSERSERLDRQTGVRVQQLTNWMAHSHHLYFTNPGWHAGGKRLLFASDRENKYNLYDMDLASGEFVQITDYPAGTRVSFLHTSVNPQAEEAYYWLGQDLVALDLTRFSTRALYRAAEGFKPGMTNVTADGRYVCSVESEDLSAKMNLEIDHGYVGFAEFFKAHPICRIVKVAVDGSGGETVHEDRTWIGHINTSPTQARLLTFCHEGPWNLVPQRIWGFDLSTGRAWKIRPQQPDEAIGHEYWLADGERIGYHGRTPGGPVYGVVRFDDSHGFEAPFPRRSVHFHSNDDRLIVGDGSREDPRLYLWRRVESGFGEPRALAWHRGSFHIQKVHVHPRFTPDGKQTLYTADHTGYGQVYLADVPDFESLPEPASA
ncbi:MAG: Oligogalacturonate lyase [candidate division BRC1 bacterium ADurb.BinA364]|nr:MAG: Oligogalacturonate lyase [candidate division BRC1 bacterium ADurb.BinA364]